MAAYRRHYRQVEVCRSFDAQLVVDFVESRTEQHSHSSNMPQSTFIAGLSADQPLQDAPPPLPLRPFQWHPLGFQHTTLHTPPAPIESPVPPEPPVGYGSHMVPEPNSFGFDTSYNDSLPESHPGSNLEFFDKHEYTRTVGTDEIKYTHSSAGCVLGKSETTWEMLWSERQEARPGATYSPFPNRAQWQLAYWLATCKASQSKIDEFLALDGILSETPCFRTAAELFNMIENDIDGFGGPEWFEQDIVLPEAPDEPLTMHLRNVEHCADYLLGRPDLAGEVTFEPEVIFELDDKTQVIREMFSANLWREILERAGQDKKAALGGVLFGSDATHLSNHAGDVKVHGFYMSLGNIHKDVRNKTSRRAWMLVGYIPMTKWELTMEKTEFRSKQHQKSLPGILNRRLLHFCLSILCEPLRTLNVHEIVDPDGCVRLIFYVLIAYLADLEEQFKIAAIDKSNCIHCMATMEDFGSPHTCEPRTSDWILASIKKVQAERGVNADPYAFSLGSDKHRLGDVEYPFWATLPLVNIAEVLALDMLHGFHKFFYDHPFDWNVNSLGREELDARTKSQVALTGGRVFPKGVTHISQMSGKEHRALQTVHVPVVANAPIPYSREVTLATQALIDYLYLARLPSHSDKTLLMYESAYARFHKLKDIWIKNGARQGDKGNTIDHFQIPKLHNAHHLVEQVRSKGTTDNYSTEVVEHLHIDTLKEPFKATNRKDWKKQTIRYLTRRDALVDFSLFLDWLVKSGRAPGELENAIDDGIRGAEDQSDKRSALTLDSSPALHMLSRPPSALSLGSHSTQPYPLQNLLPLSLSSASPLDLLRTTKHAPYGFPSRPASAFSTASQSTLESRLQPTVLVGTKRKRKSEEEKEEQNVKRITQSQELYGLSEHQDLAVRPTSRMTVAALQTAYQVPDFLTDYQASVFQASNPINRDTLVDAWQSIRLLECGGHLRPKPTWRRVLASPRTDQDVAAADAVLYTIEPTTPDKTANARLQDCKVARARVIFRIASTGDALPTRHPPLTLVYLNPFSSIPKETEVATQLYVIKKPERVQRAIVEVTRLVRICPLSPRITGAARRDVSPQTAMDKYETFYINKYFSLNDFMYMSNI